MDFVFYALPGLIIAVAVRMAVAVIRRGQQVRRNWNSGLTAQARCLRTYTTTRGSGDNGVRTTLHHVYEFTTPDGREVRFEEENGPGTTLESDVVTVHYTAERPDRATAHAPARGKALAGTIGILVFLGVVVVFCVGFMVTYNETFAGGPFASTP